MTRVSAQPSCGLRKQKAADLESQVRGVFEGRKLLGRPKRWGASSKRSHIVFIEERRDTKECDRLFRGRTGQVPTRGRAPRYPPWQALVALTTGDHGLEGCLPPEVSPQLPPSAPESACPNALTGTGARNGQATSVWAQDRHVIPTTVLRGLSREGTRVSWWTNGLLLLH